MDTSANTAPGSKTKLVKDRVVFEIDFEVETNSRDGTGLSDDRLREIMQEICDAGPPHRRSVPKLTIKSMKRIRSVSMCPNCKGVYFKHLHDEAHGLSGAHMAGSERYVCKDCGHSIYAGEGKAIGLNFVLD